EGGSMREYFGDRSSGYGTDAPYIQDPQTGAAAISRIDEQTLRTIASEMGVPYGHRISPGGIASVVGNINLELVAGDGRRDEVTTRDVYWPAAILLAVLLGWEAWDLSREVPKNRRRRRDEGGNKAVREVSGKAVLKV